MNLSLVVIKLRAEAIWVPEWTSLLHKFTKPENSTVRRNERNSPLWW